MRIRKRRLDLRKIRPSRCYTVHEIAILLSVSPGTVRAWIRRGLPILGDCKPFLVPGDGLKLWLKIRRASRKRICQPDEFYCCRCRCPRKAKSESVTIVRRNAKTIAIRALCNACGAKMNKAGSLA